MPSTWKPFVFNDISFVCMGIFLLRVQQRVSPQHLHHALLTTLKLSLPFPTGVQRWMQFSIDGPLPRAGPAARLSLSEGLAPPGRACLCALAFLFRGKNIGQTGFPWHSVKPQMRTC